MKKLSFLITLLISFGTISAQEKLSKEEQARRDKNIQAGNPFVKYGSKAPVATLSNGKYLEVHDLDSIVTIGTTRWQVEDKKIVGDIAQDTLNLDAQPIGDIPGRWISIDPLTEEFPEWSPYVSFNNNPVRYTDPTGMAPEECCDGLLNYLTGTFVGGIDNLTGSNFRAGSHSMEFQNGLATADAVSIVGGTYLAGKGIMDAGAGGVGLSSSLTATAGSGGLAIEVSGPVALASAGLMAVGAIETAVGANLAVNGMKNLKNDVVSKESGSYTNTHESGTKYHGKGDESRMNKSAAEKAKANNDPVKSQDYTPAKNSREAFKQESRRLDTDKVGNTPGHKNPNNYNKRDSPGTKYRKQDGEH
jgi:hypothetical protein